MFRDARPSRPGARPATVLLIVVVAAPGGFQWRLLSAAVAVPSGSIAPSNGRSRDVAVPLLLASHLPSPDRRKPTRRGPSSLQKVGDSRLAKKRSLKPRTPSSTSATPRRNDFAVVIDVGQMLNGVLGVESVRLPQSLPRSNAVTRVPLKPYRTTV